MDTMWTPHRFSGGALALVVANTVVMRADRERTFDRFDDAREIVHFAAAAERYCAEEIGGVRLTVNDPVQAKPRLIALREAIDALFRTEASAQGTPASHLSPLLAHASNALWDVPATLGSATLFAQRDDAVTLECATALSALRLLERDSRERIRICGNCGWLFVDRSRNGSRIWCDMSVCGNRNKARLHYRRRSARMEAIDA